VWKRFDRLSKAGVFEAFFDALAAMSSSAHLIRAMKSAYATLSRLEENPPETISELRSLEANCAASYFRSWVGMTIKWRGTSRRPIPDNWRSIGQRSSPYHLAGNRNATHAVNAILNYAYAALESEIPDQSHFRGL
jgi:CRISP-associated protein Cas1